MGIINWFKEFFGIGGNSPKENEDDVLEGYETEVVREKKSKQSEEGTHGVLGDFCEVGQPTARS